MKKKILIGSIIAVVILVLVSFSSVVGKVSSDEELVSFDVEFCGLGKKHTVQLTQQEADEVELLFDNIEQRLSKVDTREEAEEIFKDVVVQLDKYGLLGQLNIEQAQRLITRTMVNRNLLLNKEESQNQLCLIAGLSTNISFFTPFYSFFQNIIESQDFLNKISLNVLLWLFLSLIYSILPIKLLSMISFGAYNYIWEQPTEMSPSSGWVFSFGLNGLKTWNGNMIGNISEVVLPTAMGSSTFYIGTTGFTGINIMYVLNGKSFFLGSALSVNI